MGDKPNSSGSGSRPRTRQRVYKPPPPLEVPDIEEDAAERKRILNVLAQRRYRTCLEPTPACCSRRHVHLLMSFCVSFRRKEETEANEREQRLKKHLTRTRR